MDIYLVSQFRAISDVEIWEVIDVLLRFTQDYSAFMDGNTCISNYETHANYNRSKYM